MTSGGFGGCTNLSGECAAVPKSVRPLEVISRLNRDLAALWKNSTL